MEMNNDEKEYFEVLVVRNDNADDQYKLLSVSALRVLSNLLSQQHFDCVIESLLCEGWGILDFIVHL